jgi:hypothetical protein
MWLTQLTLSGVAVVTAETIGEEDCDNFISTYFVLWEMGYHESQRTIQVPGRTPQKPVRGLSDAIPLSPDCML